MLAPEQASHPAVDELIKPDSLAARRIQCLARRPARRPGNDRAKIRLLDKHVHVDTPHKIVDIDAVEHGAHIDASHHVVDVRPVEQRIHVYPVEQRVHVYPVEQRVHVQLLQDFVDVEVTEYYVQIDSRHECIDVQCADEE